MSRHKKKGATSGGKKKLDDAESLPSPPGTASKEGKMSTPKKRRFWRHRDYDIERGIESYTDQKKHQSSRRGKKS